MALTAIVTRPQPQASDWVQRLRAAGRAAEALPLLAINPAPEPAAVAAAFAALRGDALAVCVSPNAVHMALACLPGGRWPAGLRAAGVGPGTRAALRDAGVPEAQICAPTQAPYESEALWALLAAEPWRGRQVLLVRGDGGREWLGDTMRAAGAEVRAVQAYARTSPMWTPAEAATARAALAAPGAHVWLLSSSEAVAALARLMPGADWRASRAVASHGRIAEAATAAGFGLVRVVPPDWPLLLEALDALPTIPGHDGD